MKFPSIKNVARALRQHNDYLRATFTEKDRKSEDFCGDVRLQVWEDGTWTTHCGDSQYDTDHRGYWGNGYLNGSRFNSEAMAKDMINEAKEHHAEVKADRCFTVGRIY